MTEREIYMQAVRSIDHLKGDPNFENVILWLTMRHSSIFPVVLSGDPEKVYTKMHLTGRLFELEQFLSTVRSSRELVKTFSEGAG